MSTDRPAEPLDDALLRAFGDELVRLGRRRVFNPEGAILELSAFRLLWLVVEHGPRSMREIEEGLQLEQSTVSRQVNAAVKHGLVRRTTAPDQHHRLVEATDEGRRAYEHDSELRAVAYRTALTELGARHVEELVASLRAFNDVFDDALEQ